MAEFAEVIKQAKRMCRAQNKSDGCSCSACPMYRHIDGRHVFLCDSINTSNGCPEISSEEFEKIVMEWAQKNTEPKVLTWHEAWEQLFPDGQGSPCPAAYGTKYEPEWCGQGSMAGVTHWMPLPEVPKEGE